MAVITHDWEFYEDGETIHPISVGTVASNGSEYYAVFPDGFELAQETEFLRKNVLPHLREQDVKPVDVIKHDVHGFINSVRRPELWAWYGAYDHVVLAQALGPTMMDLPDGIPMFTNDIKTLELLDDPAPLNCVVIQNVRPHHALYDARFDMALYREFMDRLRKKGL